MKTTIDIPEKALKDAMRFAGTKTKRRAILAAVEEFNGRHRMAELARHLGTCKNLLAATELERLRTEGGLTIPATDLLVAACARHHGASIEHDDEHLEALAGI